VPSSSLLLFLSFQAGGTRLLKQFTPLMGGLDDVKITVSSSRPRVSLRPPSGALACSQPPILTFFRFFRIDTDQRDMYIRSIVPIGALFSGSLILSNMAYLSLSVSFIQMLKVSSFSPFSSHPSPQAPKDTKRELTSSSSLPGLHSRRHSPHLVRFPTSRLVSLSLPPVPLSPEKELKLTPTRLFRTHRA